MRKAIAAIIIIAFVATSCARSITPYEAANGKARCGRSIR
jgi:PBP1b-binding outer membrane lipoprotein LpoB